VRDDSMAEREPAGRLNPAQAGRVLATFRTIDALLEAMGSAEAGAASPFDRTVPDLEPDDIRLLESFVASLRHRMLASLDRLGIPRPEPSISARWSIETSLGFAEISINELDGRSLRAYGPVDPAAAREVDAVATELRAMIGRGLELVRRARRDPPRPEPPSRDGSGG